MREVSRYLGPCVEYAQTLRLLHLVILHGKMKWPLLPDPDQESDVTESFLPLPPSARRRPSLPRQLPSPTCQSQQSLEGR